MIDNEFGNDILTLEDDDGVEHTFEVLVALTTVKTVIWHFPQYLMIHRNRWMTAVNW